MLFVFSLVLFYFFLFFLGFTARVLLGNFEARMMTSHLFFRSRVGGQPGKGKMESEKRVGFGDGLRRGPSRENWNMVITLVHFVLYKLTTPHSHLSVIVLPLKFNFLFLAQ